MSPVSQPLDVHVLGVFQDAEWARRGLEALVRDGFAPSTLTVIATPAPGVSSLFADILLHEPLTFLLRDVGAVVGAGPLLTVLDGEDEALTRRGLTASIRRAGFQAHDGQIFQRLLARGGVLVAVLSEPRAADALARLHSYGGANAAIGAWAGRV
jgi:hypothetical protein